MKRFFTWLGQRFLSDEPEYSSNQLPPRPRPRIDPAQAHRPNAVKKQPDNNIATPIEISQDSAGGIADGGPGKNILMRPRLVREDTGTHDTLKILDDSLFDSEESDGIDPYNTGRFDRSKFWDKSSLK